ncbi:MAG: endolytic transglycosylase MltG [Actinobacteria bacterium]|nr:endolytic transglycosylase MltG [Actinomycetota bacterium]
MLVAGASATVLGYGPLASHDYRGGVGESVTVRVKPGDSLAAIARTLEGAGVVKSASYFVKRNLADSRATRVQPGYYAMFEHMRSINAFNRLFDPTARVRTRVLVPDGARASKIYERLSDRTGIPIDDFRTAAARVALPAYADGDIEGMLWPATYSFDPDATAASIIGELVTTAEREHRRLGVTQGARGLTAREVITLASIIQVESYARDYPKVSRVAFNRLERGMRLQMDSTLNYALGTAKWTFTSAERRNPSRYNTFMHDGLPIGPIGNPGAGAIRAAMNPVAGDWVYFVTTDPDRGVTEFAATYSQFEVLRRKFQQWLAAQ